MPISPEFGLLGPLQMSVSGAAVSLGGPKQRVVLATLLMNRNRPVAVDSLIAAAWEDDPPAEARANIHVYVSNLRRLANTAGVTDARGLLEKHAAGYRLTVDDGAVDVGRFLRDHTAGVRAATAGHFEQASDHLSKALAVWRGPVLEDLRQFQFIEAFAVALMEQKLAAHTARAEAEIACGRAESVIAELETLVAEHPYREPAWAQLMTAYYVSGRQSDALQAYRRLTSVLGDELGIDPNPALRNLHERILRQEPLDGQRSAQETACATMSNSVPRYHDGADQNLSAWLRSASGDRHQVSGAATSIGRLADNDIVLTDAQVSRRHAIIIDTGIGFVIHDAGSANGIRVAGQRIIGRTALANGDQLRIGGEEFTFELHPADDEQQ